MSHSLHFVSYTCAGKGRRGEIKKKKKKEEEEADGLLPWEAVRRV